MSRTLDFLLRKKANRPCASYPDAASLFSGLEREEPQAIRCLYDKVSGTIHGLGKTARLTDEDIEELICDSITIGLQKIRSGKWVYLGYSPTTYVVEIAKNRAQNFRRKMIRNSTADLDGNLKEEEEANYGTLEAVEMLEKWLSQLGDNCRRLIELKYLQGKSDKEVIAEKHTQYSTVDALKNHRSKCLKKLTALAQGSTQKPV